MFVPPIDPRSIPAPSRDIFAAMGQANIERMIGDFYAELERSTIRKMFGAEMSHGAERTAAFFVGLLGGPPLYHERYGNPMMRARHMPFPIDQSARDVWLACFLRVLDNAASYDFPAEHLPGFIAFLEGFSVWMMNSAPAADGGRLTGDDRR
jgi:hemoglobin